MATKQLSYTAAQIDAAIAKINSLILHITANVVQLYDGSTAIYPRTQAEAVFFDGDPTKTLADYMWFIREGYMYKGIVYPSTVPNTPLGKIFYLTICDDGYVYERFLNNGVILSVPKGISVISWDGSLWSATQLINIDNVPTENSNNLVKSKGVKQELDSLRNRIIDLENLGYSFGGFADFDVNPGIPTGKCFYLASKAGTYTYFKNTDEESIILEDDGIYALVYDKEELCWSYQILLNNFVYYIDNPEFVRVYLDDEGRILWGIQKDGTSVCGAGLKVNEEFNLSGVISKVIDSPEFLEVKLDAAGKIVWAIQKDGNIIFGAGVPSQIKSQLSQLEQEFNRRLDENILSIEFRENGDIVAYFGEEGVIHDVYIRPNGDIVVEQEVKVTN